MVKFGHDDNVLLLASDFGASLVPRNIFVNPLFSLNYILPKSLLDLQLKSQKNLIFYEKKNVSHLNSIAQNLGLNWSENQEQETSFNVSFKIDVALTNTNGYESFSWEKSVIGGIIRKITKEITSVSDLTFSYTDFKRSKDYIKVDNRRGFNLNPAASLKFKIFQFNIDSCFNLSKRRFYPW